MAGERKLTVTWDGKDVGLKRAADKAADDVADANRKMSDSFEEAGDEGGGSFLDGLGGKITAGIAAIGIAGAALLVEGLTSAMDLEAATDRLGAQLGDAEFGKQMGKIAGDLYVDGFGESVADTGEALRKVWQNGLIPEDAADADIERVTAKLLTFSDVMEQDMDMATQAVSSMIKSGIVDSSEEAFDVLTRGIQQGVDKSGDLLESFQEYSVQFQALGLDATTATGLMSQGLQAGARDADTVADALKEMAIRGKDGSATSAEGFRLIGLSAEEMTAKFAQGGPAARDALDQVIKGMQDLEDPAQRDAAAVALFGTKSEDLQLALANLDLDTAAAGMGDVAGSTDDLGAAYDNASSKIESFKRGALMELTEFVGGSVIPGIESLVGSLRDNLGPAFTTIKDKATEFWNALTTGQTEDEGTPLERVALAIRDAWGQLVDAWNNDLKPALDELAAKGREIVEGIDWQTVWQELGPILSAAGAAFMSFMIMAITAITTVVQNITSFINKLQEMWREHESFRVIVTAVWDVISSKVTAALNIISGVMQLATALMKGDWGAAWTAIKTIASNAWNSMTAEFRGIANTIRGIGGAMWNPISSGLSSVVSNVESQINRLIRAYNSIPFLPNVSTLSTGPARQLSVNSIPKLAAGGVVTSPTLAWLAEAGQPEAVVPLDRASSMGFGGGGDRAVLELRSSGSDTDEFLIRMMRKAVKNRGGIDVVFG